MGFCLLLLCRLPNRLLLIGGLALLLNVPSAVVRSVDVVAMTSQPGELTDQRTLLHYFETLKFGSYGEILLANLFGFKTKMQYQFSSDLRPSDRVQLDLADTL